MVYPIVPLKPLCGNFSSFTTWMFGRLFFIFFSGWFWTVQLPFQFISGGFVSGHRDAAFRFFAVIFVWGDLYTRPTLTDTQRVPNEKFNEALRRPQTWSNASDGLWNIPFPPPSVGCFPLLGGCIQKHTITLSPTAGLQSTDYMNLAE